MNLKKVDGGIMEKCAAVDGKDYYTVHTTTTASPYNKVPTDASDLLGQQIKVLVKLDSDNHVDSVYGVYADEDSKVVATGLLGDFELDGSDKIKLNGTSYKLDGAQDSNVVYTAQQKPASVAKTNFSALAALAVKGTITPTTAATSIKLIDNDGNGKVDAAVITRLRLLRLPLFPRLL